MEEFESFRSSVFEENKSLTACCLIWYTFDGRKKSSVYGEIDALNSVTELETEEASLYQKEHTILKNKKSLFKVTQLSSQ